MILQNDFKRLWESKEKLILNAVKAVGQSGTWILGDSVKDFEKHLAKTWGLSHAVGVANGMDALEISLRILGLKSGQKVLTTPLSAFASSLAIMRAGGVPVFADVDAHGLIDLFQCESFFSEHPEVKFFLPVHLYGHFLDLEKLAQLKHRFGLKIVEDCAQSIGARHKGKLSGSVGDMAATSFYPTKNLGAMGDAGAILTNNPLFAQKAMELRNYGQSEKYFHASIGLNSRLDELQARILNDVFLPELANWTKKRAATAHTYIEAITNKNLSVLRPLTPESSVWHLFPVLVNGSRESFIQHMQSQGVACGIHYPVLIPNQKALTSNPTGFEVFGPLPEAIKISNSQVSLPIHPYLEEEEIQKIIEAANSWKN